MRSYGQYCALAKALDVVGDRWTLLIVRELLIKGPCRYTDVRDGLPGIATNLLVERLRGLERAGLVRREEAPPPVATTLFHLTPRGEELETILYELGAWGAPLLEEAPESDAFCAHWLALPAERWLRDHQPDEPPVSIELRMNKRVVTLETIDGIVRTRLSSAKNPDAVIAGPPRLIAALLAGRLDIGKAQAAGLTYEGNLEILGRIQPLAL